MVPTRQEKQVGRPEGYEAVFVAEDGVEQRVPLSFMPDVVAELGRPVRSFPSYRGPRNCPGWYWSATMGGRIGFVSWVERDHLVALGFDPSVSQPFWLWWSTPAGKRRRHAPDFLVLLDGSAEGAVPSLRPRWSSPKRSPSSRSSPTCTGVGTSRWTTTTPIFSPSSTASPHGSANRACSPSPPAAPAGQIRFGGGSPESGAGLKPSGPSTGDENGALAPAAPMTLSRKSGTSSEER
jgi:hypothetical protein